jgi:hypothetical protein
MQCKSCGGTLVLRETFNREVDENGVCNLQPAADISDMALFCLQCGAHHAYDVLQESEGQMTIALEVNSDPDPVADLIITFTNEFPTDFACNQLLGLTILDRDKQEVGRFVTKFDSALLQRLWKQVLEIEKKEEE